MKASNRPFCEGFDQTPLVVCCGPGGVGKTTVAAALAVVGAERGRRTLVLTIDPARRLATCLGLDSLEHRPVPVETGHLEGQMWAMMLDTRRTFEDLISSLAPDQETIEQVAQSPLYRIFVESMHGTTEYMALESLHNVVTSGKFDLIVLDTPPMTNALDFFDVAKRASWLFDERIMKWFLPVAKRSLRERLHPGAIVVGLLKRLAGATLVGEITAFFSALETLHLQLKRRGDEVGKTLRSPETRYLIVTSPDERRVDEARYMEKQLKKLRQTADLFVVNRTHNHLLSSLEPLAPGWENLLSRAVGSDLAAFDCDLGLLGAFFERLAASARHHSEVLTRLQNDVGPERLAVVAETPEEIHDIDGLLSLGRLVVSTVADPSES